LTAFVLMPFTEKFIERFNYGVKPVAAELGIKASHVGEQQFFNESILSRIYSQIDSASLIIADMTGRNPNVFYEVGYSHAKNKFCVLLTEDVDDIPFDLQHHRHIIYGGSLDKLTSLLRADLTALKPQLLQRKPFAVKLEVKGHFDKKHRYSHIFLDFRFDLHNDTPQISPEIEAIYFHTSWGWSLTVEGQECPSTGSDRLTQGVRHFIKPPVRRLPKGQWAQAFAKGSRLIWHGNDEPPSSHHLKGACLLSVVTAEETFDYPLHIEYEVDEIPF
jgi:hypothetical protein